ncbi:MAG: hypothetical protein K0S33_2070 [Bacteroidetes bacterium]|jgi:type IX secretion system PorP/SprF family membrane protein|nr:hypothetical protein [Bacteroidota bacterium]
MKTTLTLLFTCLTIATHAQDATFSQFNAVPLYYNPAFAGAIEKPRLALSYRNQWKGGYQTGYASYDQTVRALHGGVGIIAHNDYSGHALNRFYAGAAYAPKFILSDKIGISPGIAVGYMRTSLNFNNLKPIPGVVYKIDSTITYTPSDNLDVSAGVVMNTKKFYAGFAVNHVNAPKIRIVDGGNVGSMPMKFVVQTGYTIQKTEDSDFSSSINLIYHKQSVFSFFQTNLTFRYKRVLAGIGSSNTDIYIGMLGYYSRSLVVGYSYAYFLNGPDLGGAHEITIRCFFRTFG